MNDLCGCCGDSLGVGDHVKEFCATCQRHEREYKKGHRGGWVVRVKRFIHIGLIGWD